MIKLLMLNSLILCMNVIAVGCLSILLSIGVI